MVSLNRDVPQLGMGQGLELSNFPPIDSIGTSIPGEEDDVQPLLADERESRNTPTTQGVHPLANSSYTCDKLSWGSKLAFSWIQPILDKSRGGKELQLGDTLLLPAELSAAFLSERFQRAWEAAVSRGHPSLAAIFHSLFAREFFVSGVFRLITELAKISAPMLLRELILHVKGEATVVPNSVPGGLALALILFLVVLVQACALQHFIHGVFVIGAAINTVATVAVYDKGLRLSRASLEGPRLGQALNFQAKDASKLREFVVFSHNLWAAPLTAIGCTLLLLHVLGPSALVGVSMIPVLIPLETWVAKRSGAYRKSVLNVADARISLIGEIVDGIKTVKLNSLDAAFRARVEVLRAKELASIRRALMLNAYNQAVMRSSPIVVALGTFAAYVLSGHELDAQTAFTSLALFGTIAHPFHVLPKAVQLLADARVSLERLETFLLGDETKRSEAYTADAASSSGEYDENISPKIVLKDAAFGPVAGTTCLEHVTAEMKRGLSVLTGPIGCGKTTLLHGLVEHLPANNSSSNNNTSGGGQIKVITSDGRLAFCPDTPWIVNASARDNICLGSLENFDEALYLECVAACALEQDFKEWPKGDCTVIGAKGITVSGGQKARIALARAMYANCSVVFLDDPLSALDSIVGSWVFRHAVCDMARQAVVVMTTHQHQYIRKEDCLVFVLDQGSMRIEGAHRNSVEADVTPMDTRGEAPSKRPLVLSQTPSTGKPGSTKADEVGTMLSQLSAKINVDRETGGVSKAVYIGYLKACGLLVVAIALSISVLAQFVDVSKEVVLAFWSDSARGSSMYYLSWYSAVCLSVVGMNVVRFFVICWLGLRGSEALHKSLLLKVMGAPLPFFQVTESGRITSRFSSDFDSIDLVIPTSLSSFMDAGLTMLAAVGVVVGTSPAVLFFIVPIALAYYRIQLTYRMAAKELKRLDSATKSPIFSHFQESLDGLSSIQAYRIEEKMREKNFFMVDANTRARLTWDATNRWLGIRLDYMGVIVVFLAAVMAVLVGHSTPGIVGLGLSYALTITRTLSFGVRSSTALENQFNSVERVQQFIGLKQEADEGEELKEEASRRSQSAGPSQWPSQGIEMRDVYARHRQDLPPALNGVSISVRCGERVGICGRTGSGKSTLALALVRVVESFRGSITVDGVSIKEVPLSLLRAGVTVISQDAHLFSGNVREAIDPVGQCSDLRIWDIAELVGLKDTLAELPLGLLTKVSERGNNWSAGQRQLLCIARAMVNQPGVLVFDEATANVDANTDGMIQQLIRSFLTNAAVIVIAHRLEDVVYCDRVVVMDAGSVAEDGKPSQLLRDGDSMLSKLVKELGPEMERKLREEHAVFSGKDT